MNFTKILNGTRETFAAYQVLPLLEPTLDALILFVQNTSLGETMSHMRSVHRLISIFVNSYMRHTIANDLENQCTPIIKKNAILRSMII